MYKATSKIRIVVVFFILLGQNLHAQEINGLGILELGKSEQDIIAALKIPQKDIIDGSTKTVKFIEKNVRKKVFRLKYDPLSPLVKNALIGHDNLTGIGIEKCTDAVVYLIPKSEILGADFVLFRLVFYKDELVIISTENEEMNKVLLAVFESKFGSGVTTVKNDKSGSGVYID